VKGMDDDLGGKTLKVPSSYAKKSVLYIQKDTKIPVYQEMSDDKGLFEKYEYRDVVVNPKFADDEFTTSFSDYRF
jgi:outer membrane lipoprotein-sorting protein